MKENRGSWYLLTGLLIGILAGLSYGWLVQPPVNTDTDLSTLKTSYKEEYQVLIAVAYQANGDLVRARARLNLLGAEANYLELEKLAQKLNSGGNHYEESQAVAILAADLKADRR